MGKTDYSRMFAENLKFYMNLNGKTQADLSNDLKISRATISSWCIGTRVPRPDKVDLLCNYFNIKRSDLMESRIDRIVTASDNLMSDLHLEYITKTYQSSTEPIKDLLYEYARLISKQFNVSEMNAMNEQIKSLEKFGDVNVLNLNDKKGNIN